MCRVFVVSIPQCESCWKKTGVSAVRSISLPSRDVSHYTFALNGIAVGDIDDKVQQHIPSAIDVVINEFVKIACKQISASAKLPPQFHFLLSSAYF